MALELPAEYGDVLEDLKHRVRAARLQAQRSVNTELIRLYWVLGRTIAEQQEKAGWGSQVVTRLGDDLRREFPEMTGLSRRNLVYMRTFAAAWPDETGTSQCCWTSSLAVTSGTGTPRKRPKMGGLEACWNCRSPVVFVID